MRRGLGSRGLVIFLTLFLSFEAQGDKDSDILNQSDELPFGVFPSLSMVQDEDHPDENLGGGIKNIGSRMENAVRTFANRRNFSCFRNPCLLQAFPIIYSKRSSGFFGGFHANLRDSLRGSPPIYSITGHFIRSDSNQWITYLSLDLPKIEKLPLDPRFKIKGNYNRNTENRFYGFGTDSKEALTRDDKELRFGLTEYSFQSALIVPVMYFEGDGQLSIFSSLDANEIRITRFDPAKNSKLFEDNPRGIKGGSSSSLGLGVIADTRDREVMTTSGWATEMSTEVGGSVFGDYRFQRFTFVDRRYYSWRRSTFALRTTLDAISGDTPFWELEGVGGSDPIRNVSGSGILRAYKSGRHHEKVKAIQSAEYRVSLRPRRLWGQFTEITFFPIGGDVGRMGRLWAWDLITGVDLLMNRSFLIRTFLGYAETGIAWNFGFSQEF